MKVPSVQFSPIIPSLLNPNVLLSTPVLKQLTLLETKFHVHPKL
jgi:hypothetical protein